MRVDTVAPQATIDGGPGGLTNAATLSFTFSASEAGSTFDCAIDAAAYAACTSPATYTALTDGDHTFRVRAIDAAGNPDAGDATRGFTLDRTPPPAPVISSPAEDATQSSSTVTLVGTAEAGATVEVREGTELLGTATAGDGGAWTPDIAAVADGTHTYGTPRATPPATRRPPATRTVRVDAAVPETTITSGTSGLTTRPA